MKEVKTLVKKSNKVWSCKSCDYSNKKKYLVTLHAETHVKGLMFPCKYCPMVYSNRFKLRRHTHKKHRGEGERNLRASILGNQMDEELELRGRLQNDEKRKKTDLDKEINEKVGKLMEKEGKLWKCKQCDKTSNKTNITRHCEIHLTGYSFPCPTCDHKTTNRVAMKEHIRQKHGKLPLICILF